MIKLPKLALSGLNLHRGDLKRSIISVLGSKWTLG